MDIYDNIDVCDCLFPSRFFTLYQQNCPSMFGMKTPTEIYIEVGGWISTFACSLPDSAKAATKSMHGWSFRKVTNIIMKTTGECLNAEIVEAASFRFFFQGASWVIKRYPDFRNGSVATPQARSFDACIRVNPQTYPRANIYYLFDERARLSNTRDTSIDRKL